MSNINVEPLFKLQNSPLQHLVPKSECGGRTEAGLAQVQRVFNIYLGSTHG